MSTANELGQEYIQSEIEKVNTRLEVYRGLYSAGKVKCITLRRLINLKEEELRYLALLNQETKEK